MQKNIYRFIFIVITLFLSACADRGMLAPVVESKWYAYNRNTSLHVVRRGETLYSIAFRYDQDYKKLAAYNRIRSPYKLLVGQVIRLQPSRKTQGYHTAQVANSRTYTQSRSFFSYHRYGRWLWPAKGRIVASFHPEQGKKGIDIVGHKGDKIYASQGGVVAYSGSGLAGYGNLIIIKHNNQFLTAYGNNIRNLVTEGQWIKSGQVIAEMGVIDRRYYGVHFEIRQAGHPVNPENYLY